MGAYPGKCVLIELSILIIQNICSYIKKLLAINKMMTTVNFTENSKK